MTRWGLVIAFAGMCVISLWLGAEAILSMRADPGAIFRHFTLVSQTVLFAFFTCMATLMGALMVSRMLSNSRAVLACLRVAAVFGVIVAMFAASFLIMRVVSMFV